MKTSNIIAVAFAATLFTAGLASCGDDYDDTSIKDQISTLDKRVADLEAKVKTDIEAIQAAIATINGNDFVKSVKEVEGGYEITFSKGTVAVIKDGATSALTAAKDADGNYYWQVNGQWLMDGSNKVPASRAPKMEAVADEDGKNYWKIDGEWLLDAAGSKVQVTADATPVKFDAVVSEDGRTITFKFKNVDGSTKEYVVNVAMDGLTFVANDGKLLVATPTVFKVAIPAGWDNAVVRADVVAANQTASAITRTAMSNIAVAVSKDSDNATVTLTTTDGEAGEIAELTVTMTNGDGEKRVGSIFLTVTEVNTTEQTLTVSTGGEVATAIADADAAHKVFTKIKVSGSVAMNDADWAALKSCSYMEELTIDNTVAAAVMPANAFAGNTALEKVTLTGSTFTAIPTSAFEGCTALTTFTGVAAITSIEASAFKGCTALADATLTVLSGVTTIGESAFEGCTALTTVPTFATAMVTVPAAAFKDCAALATVTWTNITSIGESAFAGTGLTTVTFATDMTAIGANAFSGCELTAVEFEAVVTNLDGIDEAAFTGVVDNAAKRTGNKNATLTFAKGQEGVTTTPLVWKGYTWESIIINSSL